jgi:hypothetical protein
MSFDPRQYARQVLIRHAQAQAEQCDNSPQGLALGAAFREVGRELAQSVETARAGRDS